MWRIFLGLGVNRSASWRRKAHIGVVRRCRKQPHSTRIEATSNGSTERPAAVSHPAGHPAPGQRLRATRTGGGITVTSRSHQHRKIHWGTASRESRAHQNQNDVYGHGRGYQEDSQPHGGSPQSTGTPGEPSCRWASPRTELGLHGVYRPMSSLRRAPITAMWGRDSCS